MSYVPKVIKAIFLSALIGTISVQQSHHFPWGFQLKCAFSFYIYSPACDQGRVRVPIQMGLRETRGPGQAGSERRCQGAWPPLLPQGVITAEALSLLFWDGPSQQAQRLIGYTVGTDLLTRQTAGTMRARMRPLFNSLPDLEHSLLQNIIGTLSIHAE